MAIKKLQNNYTTPEQSKRLLELGVPADSADCFIRLDFNVTESPDIIIYDSIFSEIKKRAAIKPENFIPCWSAGRLMEIYGICMGVEGFFYCKGNFTNEAIRRIEGSVKNNLLDFSKLEE